MQGLYLALAYQTRIKGNTEWFKNEFTQLQNRNSPICVNT